MKTIATLAALTLALSVSAATLALAKGHCPPACYQYGNRHFCAAGCYE
jgi:hypothetical protein